MAISTRPPSGTRDFLAPDVLRREFVTARIRDVYRRHGFLPLETPAIERIETLTGKYGDEGEHLIFRILKRGDALDPNARDPKDLADLGLRYDLTVPLARVVANSAGSLPRHYRRYQIQPVWRAERAQKGRFREFYQCDVDFVGTHSVVAELDVISAVTSALLALGFRNFRVHINDRRMLTGMLAVAGIPDALHTAALVAVDKLDKIGRDGVRDELAGHGIDATAADRLFAAFDRCMAPELDNPARLDALASWFDGNDAGTAGVETLRALFALLDAAGTDGWLPTVDLSLARGLSYYTGPIFEIRVDDLAGSMGGGGRYDRLVGMFSGTDIPSVGFSLGLERILLVMEERGMFPPLAASSDVMICTLDREVLPAAASLLRELRDAGLAAELHPDGGKLPKQLKTAEAEGIRFVVLLGTREVEQGVVLVKDLQSGDQRTLPRTDAANAIRDHIRSTV